MYSRKFRYYVLLNKIQTTQGGGGRRWKSQHFYFLFLYEVKQELFSFFCKNVEQTVTLLTAPLRLFFFYGVKGSFEIVILQSSWNYRNLDFLFFFCKEGWLDGPANGILHFSSLLLNNEQNILNNSFPQKPPTQFIKFLTNLT